jgi:hypothetical protein
MQDQAQRHFMAESSFQRGSSILGKARLGVFARKHSQIRASDTDQALLVRDENQLFLCSLSIYPHPTHIALQHPKMAPPSHMDPNPQYEIAYPGGCTSGN